jgi:hypothetical protein
MNPATRCLTTVDRYTPPMSRFVPFGDGSGQQRRGSNRWRRPEAETVTEC